MHPVFWSHVLTVSACLHSSVSGHQSVASWQWPVTVLSPVTADSCRGHAPTAWDRKLWHGSCCRSSSTARSNVPGHGECLPVLLNISVHVATSDHSDTRTKSGLNILEPASLITIPSCCIPIHNTTPFCSSADSHNNIQHLKRNWKQNLNLNLTVGDVLLWTDIEEMKVGR